MLLSVHRQGLSIFFSFSPSRQGLAQSDSWKMAPALKWIGFFRWWQVAQIRAEMLSDRRRYMERTYMFHRKRFISALHQWNTWGANKGKPAVINHCLRNDVFDVRNLARRNVPGINYLFIFIYLLNILFINVFLLWHSQFLFFICMHSPCQRSTIIATDRWWKICIQTDKRSSIQRGYKASRLSLLQ